MQPPRRRGAETAAEKRRKCCPRINTNEDEWTRRLAGERSVNALVSFVIIRVHSWTLLPLFSAAVSASLRLGGCLSSKFQKKLIDFRPRNDTYWRTARTLAGVLL